MHGFPEFLRGKCRRAICTCVDLSSHISPKCTWFVKIDPFFDFPRTVAFSSVRSSNGLEGLVVLPFMIFDVWRENNHLNFNQPTRKPITRLYERVIFYFTTLRAAVLQFIHSSWVQEKKQKIRFKWHMSCALSIGRIILEIECCYKLIYTN